MVALPPLLASAAITNGINSCLPSAIVIPQMSGSPLPESKSCLTASDEAFYRDVLVQFFPAEADLAELDGFVLDAAP